MLEDGLYYKRCRRQNNPGDAHELTFGCFHNQQFLSSDRTCRWLAESIQGAREKHGFSLWAYVFMPEHVHLLVCPQREAYSVPRILQSIKQPVAQKAIMWLKRTNSDGLRALATGQRHRKYRFWQDGGGYDRNVAHPVNA